MDASVISNGNKFLQFLNRSPTPFHVVDSAKQLLRDAGFLELKLSEPWQTSRLGKYFVTKNESTLFAFAVGGQYTSGNGFAIVGAHTDSPCLKLKLVSKRVKSDYLQVGVECYGGGIWHTWFDRDLSLAGRVLLNRDGKVQHRLVDLKRPLLRIPNLAIHLNRETNDKFSPNKESHLVPILATVVQEQLHLKATKSANDSATTPAGAAADKDKNATTTTTKKQTEKHHSLLVDLICKELTCNADEITDLELMLFDTQPAVLGGAFSEFIFGARLDNQVGSYCTLVGLIDSLKDQAALQSETGIRMVGLYDHEEIGSESAQGAASALTEHIMRRLSDPASFELAVTRSFLISADQAHAVHPNYSEVHEENHRPSLNGGVVLKYNGNQRYATNSVTASILREVALKAGVPVQDFMVKNDCACGSTIGPILSAKLGLTTVDIGAPQLSMHSIRETGSTTSITHLSNLIASYFTNYTNVRASYSEFM